MVSTLYNYWSMSIAKIKSRNKGQVHYPLFKKHRRMVKYVYISTTNIFKNRNCPGPVQHEDFGSTHE